MGRRIVLEHSSLLIDDIAANLSSIARKIIEKIGKIEKWKWFLPSPGRVVRAHHLVVLMVDDVAVPDILRTETLFLQYGWLRTLLGGHVGLFVV